MHTHSFNFQKLRYIFLLNYKMVYLIIYFPVYYHFTTSITLFFIKQCCRNQPILADSQNSVKSPQISQISQNGSSLKILLTLFQSNISLTCCGVRQRNFDSTFRIGSYLVCGFIGSAIPVTYSVYFLLNLFKYTGVK